MYEIGRPEGLLFVENFVADSAAVRKALRRHQDSQLTNLIIRDKYFRSIVSNFIRNFLGLQVRDYLSGIHGFKLIIQQPERGGGQTGCDENKKCDQTNCNTRHGP